MVASTKYMSPFLSTAIPVTVHKEHHFQSFIDVLKYFGVWWQPIPCQTFRLGCLFDTTVNQNNPAMTDQGNNARETERDARKRILTHTSEKPRMCH